MRISEKGDRLPFVGVPTSRPLGRGTLASPPDKTSFAFTRPTQLTPRFYEGLAKDPSRIHELSPELRLNADFMHQLLAAVPAAVAWADPQFQTLDRYLSALDTGSSRSDLI